MGYDFFGKKRFSEMDFLGYLTTNATSTFFKLDHFYQFLFFLCMISPSSLLFAGIRGALVGKMLGLMGVTGWRGEMTRW
jgi:hypothetical protein